MKIHVKRNVYCNSIFSSEDFGGYTEDNKGLVQLLQAKGFDTTFHKYELCFLGEGEYYEVTFKCPGDYLAYFSMAIHNTPNLENLGIIFSEYGEIIGFLDENPTLDDIYREAYKWWSLGDDGSCIVSLTNLDTKKTLYEDESVYENEYLFDNGVNEYEGDSWI